jgi:alpha-L-fucosidase 2
MGANIFGRTDTERIQLTEKTICNEGLYGKGGLTSCAEIYLDFNHSNVQNYRRAINLNEAIATVKYNHDGIQYTREHFMSYPDNILAIKLTANQREKLSFTLRPEIPYLIPQKPANAKTAAVVAKDDLITLAGTVEHFSVNYEVQIKVIHEGGSLTAFNEGGKGRIRVTKANSVVLLISADTNYVLNESVFTQGTHNEKLDINQKPHAAVSKRIRDAAAKGYDNLRVDHLKDYQNLFDRVSLRFTSDIPQEPTRVILEQYKQQPSNRYLEELIFHYSRYLLIASSRQGTLPGGLQGVWSQYEVTPWTGGFWHNINVQMNYWGAFSTNLTETFLPYIEFHEAYRPQAKILAGKYLQEHCPDRVSKNPADNGWTIGTGSTPYKIVGPGGHSGPGTGALTAKLFWDYYDFTGDIRFLREKAYPAILGMSKFLAKTVVPSEDGLLLVKPSASPEQRHNGIHYVTTGTTFDQCMVWENHNDLLKVARILKIDNEFVELARTQMTKLDPILIGKSGQVKEYREEDFYGDIGDKGHRHISHLCALYPGTLINSTTKAWMDAAIYSLGRRGNNTTGWAMAHRMNCRARTKDGEKTHEVYVKFLRERTLPNLWTTHPPFQIDGNLGCMAGVAEMLLQSHEGYIELLPALPDAWPKGSVKGLCARGGFEIDIDWKDGQLLSATVRSKPGTDCTVQYKGKTLNLSIKKGKKVKFTGKDFL